MKRHFLVVLFSVVIIGVSGASILDASAQFVTSTVQPKQQPTVLVVPPRAIFVPGGFDDNDKVQIVVSGVLPSACYKSGPVSTSIDHKNKQILIKNQTYKYSGNCLQMVDTYEQTLDIGIVPTGRYSVIALGAPPSGLRLSSVTAGPNPGVVMGSLTVKQAKSTLADEVTYMPIKAIQIIDRGADYVVVQLRSRFSAACMSLDTIRVVHDEIRNPRVFELLPIAKIERPETCQAGTRLFDSAETTLQTTVKLTGFLAGQSLIHVRSLNGSSINELVDF